MLFFLYFSFFFFGFEEKYFEKERKKEKQEKEKSQINFRQTIICHYLTKLGQSISFYYLCLSMNNKEIIEQS